MSKLKLLLATSAMVGALAGAAIADDTSSTNVARKAVQPVGASPQVGFVHQTVSAGGVSAGAFTFDVPAPRGTTNIIGCQLVAYDVSGSVKRLNITRSGKTVTVGNSNAASGTIATGDLVRGICVYNP